MNSTNRMFWRLVSVVLLLVALAGCSNIREEPEPPKVRLSTVKLLQAGVLEQRFQLGLRVQNPNSFGLNVSGMDYEVQLNGEQFASGVTDQSVSLPAYGETVVNVPVTTSLMDMFRQIRQWQSKPPKNLDYKLTGGVRLTNFGFRVPFSYDGSVPLQLEN